jgi:hypothetical protein
MVLLGQESKQPPAPKQTPNHAIPLPRGVSMHDIFPTAAADATWNALLQHPMI